tara:strand:+ start:9858 stop:11096 length:1239 start_codon:yes stop_codon:yes gene_type:complete
VSYLLRSAKIIDSTSEFHLQNKDILIENGFISSIKDEVIAANKDVEVIKHENLLVSPGWIDPLVDFGEPGFEQRQGLENGIAEAIQGGFCTIGVLPNTEPVIDHGSILDYFNRNNVKINIHVNGTVSKNLKGEQLSEMFDLNQNGAISFTDYKRGLNNPQLLKLALQYTQNFGGLVVNYPLDENLMNNGLMHEGKQSIRLGLKGISYLSEEVRVLRDLEILRYTKGKMHFACLSSAKAVDYVSKAKEEGLKVSCSVTPHHLFFNDSDIKHFDTLFKTLPPLRTKNNNKKLISQINEGMIDFVHSDHFALHTDMKETVFDQAEFGAESLGLSFGALTKTVNMEKAVELLTNAYEIFSLKRPEITLNSPASLSLFCKQKHSLPRISDSTSIWKNESFEYLPLGILNNGKAFLTS